MRALVINLTRFGDLLQTQPVVSGLRRQGYAVDLLCLDAFSSASNLLQGLDRTLVLPGAKLLAALDTHWSNALALFSVWQKTSGARKYKRVINLTPMLSARVLTRCFSVKQVDGFLLDELGFGVYSSPWAAFLQAASKFRGCSPFNIVDLFLRVAELPPEVYCLVRPDSQLIAEAQSSFGIAANQKFFAIQLGASQEHRRWPVRFFVQAARLAWKKSGVQPVLLGSDAESALGARFLAQADFPCVNLIGQTSLPDLAAILSQMRALLTNDTGTMHLAAGLDVPVLALFLTTAQPFDTGPYRENCLSLEPDLACHPCRFGQTCPYDFVCRQQIAPTGVGQLLGDFLRTGRWSQKEISGARVWLSQRDAQGFLELQEAGGGTHAGRAAWIAVQRQIYRQFLDQPNQPFPEGVFQTSPLVSSDPAFAANIKEAGLLLRLIKEQARALRAGVPVQQKFLMSCQRLTEHFSSSRDFGVLGPLWMYQSQQASASLEDFIALCQHYQRVLNAFAHCLPSGMA